jgi:hypothetical protein
MFVILSEAKNLTMLACWTVEVARPFAPLRVTAEGQISYEISFSRAKVRTAFMRRQLLEFFGSLRLAVVLLVGLALILAVATFYESATSTKAAVLHVYRSWWFNALLGLLAVNLAAAALSRWPWKRRHIGFVITHAGIIILLGGCSASFIAGTEGMMELHVGANPINVIRVDEGGSPGEALTILVPERQQRIQQAVHFRRNGAILPQKIALTKTATLTLDEYWPNSRLVKLVESSGITRNPALQFRLESELAQQNVSEWLLADSADENRVSLGPANIMFVKAIDDSELKRLTTDPAEESNPSPQIQIVVAGKPFSFDVAENLDEPLPLGDSGITARIMGYWPDFRMDENHKPTSASDEPNNPAAVVIVSRGEDEQRAFVFADPQIPPIVRTTAGKPIDVVVQLLANQKRGESMLTVVLAPDDKLYFAAKSKNGFKSGELVPGQSLQPGWMDFKFTAEKFIPNAIVSERLERAPDDPDGGFPAIRVTAHAGNEHVSQWARFGAPVVMQLGGATFHVMYAWDSMQLPFTVALENFEVHRDEGSDNVAGWTSHIVFDDPARGMTQRARIWMNHPTWFGGWKFSQASWNPNDLQYSALQVKKDPRYVSWLTWIGSALIVIGTALLFWFRRWFQNGEPVPEEVRREEELVAT